MATSIVPIVYPFPSFSGRKKEDVLKFIEAVHYVSQLEKVLLPRGHAGPQQSIGKKNT
jgi:hypothetical protein